MRIAARYAWTVFVLLAVALVVFGASDLPGAKDSTALENAFNQLFIGVLAGAIAVTAFRAGARWAWLTMATWLVWLAAQAWRGFAYGKAPEAWTVLVLMVLAAAALAVTAPAMARRQEHEGQLARN